MKPTSYFVLCAALLLSTFYQFVDAKISITTTYDPLLVVVIMVKNEEDVIKETLRRCLPADKDLYQHVGFLIFDTGSQDGTIEKTEEFFKENNITKGIVIQEPFVGDDAREIYFDYGWHRNRALDLAKKHFPQAGYHLMPDAEWYLNGMNELLEFCAMHQHEKSKHSFVIRLLNASLDFYHHRLFRADSDIRFVGAIHEVPSCGVQDKAPAICHFELLPGAKGAQKSQARYSRDKKILLKAHHNDPQSTRTLYYLAQTCACLGEWEQAWTYFKKRTEMRGFDQEDYCAMYWLARCTHLLNDPKTNDRWPEAMSYYLQAHQMRPCRIEPLVRIAQHYIADQHAIAYIFALRACQKPYPDNELLFVEKDLYDYERYNLLGWACWYTGDLQLGEWAIKKALSARPDYPHLHRNFALYAMKNHPQIGNEIKDVANELMTQTV